uniref:C-type lectin domain-containing protein n=1 Tax=Pygocentrus nattereri TaxID=42514 RepID=A0A3B4DPA7_PYGNA
TTMVENLYRNTTVCIICHTGKYCSHPSLEIPLILINQKKTWREALSYCRENHVDLVSVHTEEIQHWVEKACWTWSDGSYFSYSNWNSREPNNAGTGNCGELRSKDEYRWNDAGCSNTNQFVCYNSDKQWVSLPEEQRLNFICTTSEGEDYTED